jgi:hypothetical protein
MSRRAGWSRSSTEPLEVGQPELDQRPDALLEPGLRSDGKRLLVALARLFRIDSLLETVVTGDEKLLDSLTRLVALHIRTVAVHISTGR